jgi:hypothetical protein
MNATDNPSHTAGDLDELDGDLGGIHVCGLRPLATVLFSAGPFNALWIEFSWRTDSFSNRPVSCRGSVGRDGDEFGGGECRESECQKSMWAKRKEDVLCRPSPPSQKALVACS